MSFFRKKPVVIDAMQFDGGNSEEIIAWAKSYGGMIRSIGGFAVDILAIDARECRTIVTVGDWVIRGTKNEFYSCEPDIFSATYDPV